VSKRAFDLVMAAVLLIAFAPVLGLAALVVRLSLGSPVFFKQVRPGLHERPFTLIKFRTMKEGYDAAGRPLDDHERITRIGRLFRASSVDELPELWNVLKGDMSLVGPRPLLMEYLTLYSPVQARRHTVRPGLTGWAQVHGRNAVSWEDKFELDVWYVEHRSFLLDLKIIWLTVWVVITSRGVAQPGHVTAEPFRGRTG